MSIFNNISLMMELKNIMGRLQRSHPKFPLFMQAVMQGGIESGTVIEVKVTKPDGREYITNVRLNDDDMECFRKLNELQREAGANGR